MVSRVVVAARMVADITAINRERVRGVALGARALLRGAVGVAAVGAAVACAEGDAERREGDSAEHDGRSSEKRRCTWTKGAESVQS